MSRFTKWCAVAAMALIVSLATAGQARANSYALGAVPSVTPLGGGIYRWDYNVVLSADETLRVSDGAFFIITDFFGYVPMTAQYVAASGPATTNWTASYGASACGFNQACIDNAGIGNLIFTYSGANYTSPAAGPTSLGTFRAHSTSNIAVPSLIQGTYRDFLGISGSTQNAQSPAPIPEPASMVLLGTGLLGLAKARRRARKN